MQILKIINQIDDLLAGSGGLKVSEILKKFYLIAKLCREDKLEEWILLESSGYTDTNPAMHDEVVVPPYRKVPGQYHDKSGQPLVIDDPDIFKMVNNYPLRESAAELEQLAQHDGTLSFRNPYVMKMIHNHFNVEVDQFAFRALSLQSILQEIRNQAVNKLVGLRDKLSTKALTDGIDPETPAELATMHPVVQQRAGRLYRDGHYRQAILDTYIALVEAVKNKTDRHDLDGTPLMQTAFGEKNPILKISDSTDEQRGFMWLFSGAVMGIRNPKAHRLVEQTDPQRTLEWLGFASVLLRVLDEAPAPSPPSVI